MAYIRHMALPMNDGVPAWTLGDRLVRSRRQADMKQAEMALRLGMSRAAVGAYENDVTEPKSSVLAKWAAITGVSLRWLIGSPDGGGGQPERPTIWSNGQVKRRNGQHSDALRKRAA